GREEVFFCQVHQLTQPDLGWGVLLRVDESFLAGRVVDFDQNQPCLNARNVQRQHAGRVNVEHFAIVHQTIPNADCLFPGHPDLEAKVAGVAGSRDVDRYAGDLASCDAEILQVVNLRVRDALEQAPGGGALQGKSGNLFGNVFDLHVEADCILLEPAEARIGGGPAIIVFAETSDGAVVDDLALGIAPAAVDDLVDRNFADVAGDDAVDKL